MISISGYPISNKEHDVCDDKNYLRLNNCGYLRFMTKSMEICRSNGRKDYQLIYITKGNACFNINGQTEEIMEGNCILYRPGEFQYYTYHGNCAPEVYWIHFTGTGVNELLAAAGLSGRQRFTIGESSIPVNYYKKIITEMQLKRTLYNEAINAAFIELLVFIGRKLCSDEKQGDVTRNENLHAVIELLNTHYKQNWSIEKLAGMVSLSPYRFMHNFKACTGMPAMEYLTNIRIEKAKDLLADSSLSIKEISDTVGYSDPLYFSTLFRRTTGMSPSLYRKKRS